jgi:hypothetical protein
MERLFIAAAIAARYASLKYMPAFVDVANLSATPPALPPQAALFPQWGAVRLRIQIGKNGLPNSA